MFAKPPPYTNCYAKTLEDSALKTNLEINVTAIEIFSLLTYFNEFKVR